MDNYVCIFFFTNHVLIQHIVWHSLSQIDYKRNYKDYVKSRTKERSKYEKMLLLNTMKFKINDDIKIIL